MDRSARASEPTTGSFTGYLRINQVVKIFQNIKSSIFNKSSDIIADWIVTGSETGYRELKRLFILEFNIFIIKNFLAIANINTIIAFEFTRPIQCPPKLYIQVNISHQISLN